MLQGRLKPSLVIFDFLLDSPSSYLLFDLTSSRPLFLSLCHTHTHTHTQNTQYYLVLLFKNINYIMLICIVLLLATFHPPLCVRTFHFSTCKSNLFFFTVAEYSTEQICYNSCSHFPIDMVISKFCANTKCAAVYILPPASLFFLYFLLNATFNQYQILMHIQVSFRILYLILLIHLFILAFMSQFKFLQFYNV